MSFEDLLRASEVNKKLSQLSPYVFKRKYSNHKIEIQNNFQLPVREERIEPINIAGIKINPKTISNALELLGLKTKTVKPTIKSHIESSSMIELIKYETIVKTFTHFGHVISKLCVFYYAHRQLQAELMGELISNYSSKSLIEVEFHNCASNYILNPLENVRIVTFALNLDDFAETNLPINKLFPALHRLHFHGYGKDLSYINCHMPNLQHLRISFVNEFWWKRLRQHFEMVFTKNPQISSIDLNAASNMDHFHSEYLENISALLGNLETLTVSGSVLVDREICFDNVTIFSIAPLFGSPQNLHFPKLKQFCIKNKPLGLAEDWIDFIKQHKQLTRLRMEHSRYFRDEEAFEYVDNELEQIVAELPNLTELSLTLSVRRISRLCIGNLIENYRNLLRLDLEFYTVLYGNTVKEYLREVETVDREWIVENNGYSLSCYRKGH